MISAICKLVFFASAIYVVRSDQKVVVMSFSGISINHILLGNSTPYLNEFSKQSAVPRGLRNDFANCPLAVQFAIATGNKPNVDDFNDNNKRHAKPITNDEHHKVLPIWIENQKMGDGRNSGIMMWPESDKYPQDVDPAFIEKKNENIEWSSRVDTIISWIKNENKPANLVLSYFEKNITHNDTTVDSEDEQNPLEKLDNTVKYMAEKLESEKLKDVTNLIILIFLDSSIEVTEDEDREIDVNSLFMASGPKFKKDFASTSIDILDIHPLIKHLLYSENSSSSDQKKNVLPSTVHQLLSS